jgi:hypothetical protein
MGNRLLIIEKDGFIEGTRIIVDTETGVQYLMAHWTNIGGIAGVNSGTSSPITGSTASPSACSFCSSTAGTAAGTC